MFCEYILYISYRKYIKTKFLEDFSNVYDNVDAFGLGRIDTLLLLLVIAVVVICYMLYMLQQTYF